MLFAHITQSASRSIIELFLTHGFFTPHTVAFNIGPFFTL